MAARIGVKAVIMGNRAVCSVSFLTHGGTHDDDVLDGGGGGLSAALPQGTVLLRRRKKDGKSPHSDAVVRIANLVYGY